MIFNNLGKDTTVELTPEDAKSLLSHNDVKKKEKLPDLPRPKEEKLNYNNLTKTLNNLEKTMSENSEFQLKTNKLLESLNETIDNLNKALNKEERKKNNVDKKEDKFSLSGSLSSAVNQLINRDYKSWITSIVDPITDGFVQSGALISSKISIKTPKLINSYIIGFNNLFDTIHSKLTEISIKTDAWIDLKLVSPMKTFFSNVNDKIKKAADVGKKIIHDKLGGKYALSLAKGIGSISKVLFPAFKGLGIGLKNILKIPKGLMPNVKKSIEEVKNKDEKDKKIKQGRGRNGNTIRDTLVQSQGNFSSYLSQVSHAIFSENPAEGILNAVDFGKVFQDVFDIPGHIPFIGGFFKFLGSLSKQIIDILVKPLKEELTYFSDIRQYAFQTSGVVRNQSLSPAEATAQQELELRHYQLTLQNVLETGQSINTVERTQLTFLRRGIREVGNLNRVMRTGLNIASQLGSSAEETTNLFADMHQNLQLGVHDLANMGNGLRRIARETGITGDNLIRVVRSSEAILKNLQNSGALTGRGVNNITGALAQAQTTGTTESVTSILTELSRNAFAGEGGDESTRQLIYASAAGNRNLIEQIQNNTLISNREGMRQLAQGMQSLFRDITGGRTMQQLNANPNARAYADAVSRNLFRRGIDEFSRTVISFTESTRSFTDRLNILNRRGETAPVLRERNELIFGELQGILSDLGTSLTNTENDLGRALRDFNNQQRPDLARNLRAIDAQRPDAPNIAVPGQTNRLAEQNVRRIINSLTNDLNTRLRSLNIQESARNIDDAVPINGAIIADRISELQRLTDVANTQARANTDPLSTLVLSTRSIEALIRKGPINQLLTRIGTGVDSLARSFNGSDFGRVLNDLMRGRANFTDLMAQVPQGLAELGAAILPILSNLASTAGEWIQTAFSFVWNRVIWPVLEGSWNWGVRQITGALTAIETKIADVGRWIVDAINNWSPFGRRTPVAQEVTTRQTQNAVTQMNEATRQLNFAQNPNTQELRNSSGQQLIDTIDRILRPLRETENVESLVRHANNYVGRSMQANLTPEDRLMQSDSRRRIEEWGRLNNINDFDQALARLRDSSFQRANLNQMFAAGTRRDQGMAPLSNMVGSNILAPFATNSRMPAITELIEDNLNNWIRRAAEDIQTHNMHGALGADNSRIERPWANDAMQTLTRRLSLSEDQASLVINRLYDVLRATNRPLEHTSPLMPQVAPQVPPMPQPQPKSFIEEDLFKSLGVAFNQDKLITRTEEIIKKTFDNPIVNNITSMGSLSTRLPMNTLDPEEYIKRQKTNDTMVEIASETSTISEHAKNTADNTEETNQLIKNLINKMGDLVTVLAGNNKKRSGSNASNGFAEPYFDSDLSEEIEWPQQYGRNPGLGLSSNNNA